MIGEAASARLWQILEQRSERLRKPKSTVQFRRETRLAIRKRRVAGGLASLLRIGPDSTAAPDASKPDQLLDRFAKTLRAPARGRTTPVLFMRFSLDKSAQASQMGATQICGGLAVRIK